MEHPRAGLRHEPFRPRNIWSLFGSFTEALKGNLMVVAQPGRIWRDDTDLAAQPGRDPVTPPIQRKHRPIDSICIWGEDPMENGWPTV